MILALAMLLGPARAEEPAAPEGASSSPVAVTLSLDDEEREGLREALGASR